MQPLSPFPVLAPYDGRSSNVSGQAVESYYTNEDIEILHRIVTAAQESLETLPERERLPTNALFKAYDAILPCFGIEPEEDNHISRLVFRVGGERGDGSLADKLRSVLSRLGIEIELHDSTTPVVLTAVEENQPRAGYFSDEKNSDLRSATNIYRRNGRSHIHRQVAANVPKLRHGWKANLLLRPDSSVSGQTEQSEACEAEFSNGRPLSPSVAGDTAPSRHSPHSGPGSDFRRGASDTTFLSEDEGEYIAKDAFVSQKTPEISLVAALSQQQITIPPSTKDLTEHTNELEEWEYRGQAPAGNRQETPRPWPAESVEASIEYNKIRTAHLDRLRHLVCRALQLQRQYDALEAWDERHRVTRDRDAVARRHLVRMRSFNGWLAVTGKARYVAGKLKRVMVLDGWGSQLEQIRNNGHAVNTSRGSQTMRGILGTWDMRVARRCRQAECDGDLRIETARKARANIIRTWAAKSSQARVSLRRQIATVGVRNLREVVTNWVLEHIFRGRKQFMDHRIKQACLLSLDMQAVAWSATCNRSIESQCETTLTMALSAWSRTIQASRKANAHYRALERQRRAEIKTNAVTIWEGGRARDVEIDLWTTRARYYLLVTEAIQKWESALAFKRQESQERARQLYVLARRWVKRSTARETISVWTTACGQDQHYHLIQQQAYQLRARYALQQTIEAFGSAVDVGSAARSSSQLLVTNYAVVRWLDRVAVNYELQANIFEWWIESSMSAVIRAWEGRSIRVRANDFVGSELRKRQRREIVGQSVRQWLAQCAGNVGINELSGSGPRHLQHPEDTQRPSSLRLSLVNRGSMWSMRSSFKPSLLSTNYNREVDMEDLEGALVLESSHPGLRHTLAQSPASRSTARTSQATAQSDSDDIPAAPRVGGLVGNVSLNTPARSTGFRLPTPNVMSTTPMAPLSTSYERELRRQLSSKP